MIWYEKGDNLLANRGEISFSSGKCVCEWKGTHPLTYINKQFKTLETFRLETMDNSLRGGFLTHLCMWKGWRLDIIFFSSQFWLVNFMKISKNLKRNNFLISMLGYFLTLLISTLIHTCTYTYRKGKSTDMLFGPFQKELEIWRWKSFNKNKIELKSKTFWNLQTDTHIQAAHKKKVKGKSLKLALSCLRWREWR